MTSAAPYQKRWVALVVISLSVVVIGMDNTILNVALPTIARELRATASELQWMVDSYVLVFAGLLLTSGALGDRFGRKRVMNIGLALFLAGSVASAFAGSPTILIATRAAMGFGAAMIFPSTLSIITNVFPSAERARAIGVWAGVAGIGIVLGPLFGGFLLERFFWGSVFLVNVPVVAVTLLAGWSLVPESRDPDATPLDGQGAVLSIGALAALVYAIIEGPSRGWTDPLILACFGVAALLSGVFAWWELRALHPMLRLEFFRNPRFSAASGAVTVVFAVLFGSVFLLTQYLQFVRSYTPFEAGVRVVPLASLIVAAPLSARLAERFGTKLVVCTGLLIVAAGLGLLSTVELATGYAFVGACIAMMGFGLGLTMAPATESIMGSLPEANASVGSAMNDTTREVGGALGVAILGSILASTYASTVAPALDGLSGGLARAARDSIGASVALATQLGVIQGRELLVAARAAFIHGMSIALVVAASVAVFGALLVLRFLPAKALERVESEVEVDLAA